MTTKPLSKTLALILLTLIILLVCGLVWALAIAQTVSASTVDQITVTATPHQPCHVTALMFVKPGVSINVRPTPSRNTTPMFTINATANPYSIIELVTLADGSKWLGLCSINRQYVVNDSSLNSFVTVTPSATQAQPTPTRLVSNTPSPVATATPTSETFTWFAVDTEHNGAYTVLHCNNPCRFIISDHELTSGELRP